MARLVIEPVKLHWLYDEEPTDLCAHGGISVTFEGRLVFLAGADDDGWSVSTAALHLLRTLNEDWAPSGKWGRQLIPCCGNFMGISPKTNTVENCGCPNGVDWRITHKSDGVHIELDEQVAIRVSQNEWRIAVKQFSSKVRAFYFDPPRQAADEDAAWHAAFTQEWEELHTAAG